MMLKTRTMLQIFILLLGIAWKKKFKGVRTSVKRFIYQIIEYKPT